MNIVPPNAPSISRDDTTSCPDRDVETAGAHPTTKSKHKNAKYLTETSIDNIMRTFKQWLEARQDYNKAGLPHYANKSPDQSSSLPDFSTGPTNAEADARMKRDKARLDNLRKQQAANDDMYRKKQQSNDE